MLPKGLGTAREEYAPGASWVWGPAHRQPRHPLGQKAADSTSPPFLPGSTVHSLLCCCLSSACIFGGDDGILQNCFCFHTIFWVRRDPQGSSSPSLSEWPAGDWTRDPGVISILLWPKECAGNASDQGWSPPLSPHSLRSQGVSDSRGMEEWLSFVSTSVSAGYTPAQASHCPSYSPWCRKLPLKKLHLQQGG